MNIDDTFKYQVHKDYLNVFDPIIIKNKDDSIWGIRIMAVNWMYLLLELNEVSTPNCFFYTVNYLDRLFQREQIDEENITYYIISVIVLASKMEEICPITFELLKKYIPNENNDSNNTLYLEFCKMEKNVLYVLEFDLATTTIYSFLLHFFKFIPNINVELKSYALFVARIVLLDEKFLYYSNYLKAICILEFSVDLLKLEEKDILIPQDYIDICYDYQNKKSCMKKIIKFYKRYFRYHNPFRNIKYEELSD